MPRINIDDRLFADHRFIELVAEIGNRAEAIGTCVILFQMGQRYWVNKKSLIPPSVFKKLPHSNLIEKVELVTRKRKGFYVHGSEAYFDWILTRHDAGRKGRETQAKNRGGAMAVPRPPAPVIDKKKKSEAQQHDKSYMSKRDWKELAKTILEKQPGQMG